MNTRATIFLLDTHVWIWMLEEYEKRLSEKVLRFLRERGEAGEIVVSDISFWEVANKSAKENLFSIAPMVWLERAAAVPGVMYLPLERSALIQSTQLTGSPPRDPADRILIATAQLNRATLVTADAKIIEYARGTNSVSVYDSRI